MSVLVTLVGFLVVEYRFFKSQSHKILDLRDDYRNYLIEVKRVLTEYNKTKMFDAQSTASTEEKKKHRN